MVLGSGVDYICAVRRARCARANVSDMPLPAELIDGYYWARHHGKEYDLTTYIVLLEDGQWFTVGIEHPVDFDPEDIICRVQRPDN